MKKIIFIFVILICNLSKAQNTRNDNYSSLGILTSFEKIPFGISLYNISKDHKFGFFTELKFNRLSFDSDYTFQGYGLASDTLRNVIFDGNKKMIKMINIGTVFNPQELGIMNWDFIDIDICLGFGYIQQFSYNFYNDTQGIQEIQNEKGDIIQYYSSPLNKYYVISYNNHGININFGTNLSFQRIPFMIHIGYDLQPKTWALGFNWKVK